MFVKVDQRRTRRSTVELLDLVEQGVINKDQLIRDLLNWMSEAEVAEFATHNGYNDFSD